MQPNTTYSFAVYVSNVVNPDLSGVHNPIIQLYADDVALSEPFDVPLDSVSDQDQDIWTRLEQTFTTGAGQTSATLRLVDSATSSYGDDLAIAGLGVFACEPPYISLNLRAFLQGAYASSDGRMRDNLRQKSYLPLTQPYNDRQTITLGTKPPRLQYWRPVAMMPQWTGFWWNCATKTILPNGWRRLPLCCNVMVMWLTHKPTRLHCGSLR
ncbi:MAG: hypothetical protein HZT40_17760 [Candidatus Thiothrix singaporensis]|uniref:Uncharacterized protein n=1 Tax=Candidatus Thiothrix singaporensis TaxID=2799669 RepID=A0A7L6AVJ0_9GAMM|nr:MAG: hypothetical protein HZT40_17760 [Candidatus Thiothrix singaporensis]